MRLALLGLGRYDPSATLAMFLHHVGNGEEGLLMRVTRLPSRTRVDEVSRQATASKAAASKAVASKAAPPSRSADSLLALQRHLGNRAVVEELTRPVEALVHGEAGRHSPPGPPTIRRYFDLRQAAHAKTGVAASGTTRFPGHNKDGGNEDFLTGTTGQGQVNRVELRAVPDLMVADDGKMAIESSAVEGSREVEAFFAAPDVVSRANTALKKVGSTFMLSAEKGQTVTAPDLATNRPHVLNKVVAAEYAGYYLFGGRPQGPTLMGPEQCNEMAAQVMGTQQPKFLLNLEGDTPGINTRDLGQQLLLYLAAYIEAFQPGGDHEGDHAESQKLAAAALSAPPPRMEDKYWDSPRIKVRTASREALKDFVQAVASYQGRHNRYRPIFSFNYSPPVEVGEEWEQIVPVIDEAWADRWRDAIDDDSLNRHILDYDVLSPERSKKPVDPEEALEFLEGRKRALIRQVQDSPEVFEAINARLGMNEHALPGAGEGYEIFHKGDGSGSTFPYHFAGVVAASGPDTVTYENYARERKSTTGSDQRMYFQMYGPKREITETDTGVSHSAPGGDETAQEQEQRELEQGSFHGRWKHLFVDSQTMVVGKNERG